MIICTLIVDYMYIICRYYMYIVGNFTLTFKTPKDTVRQSKDFERPSGCGEFRISHSPIKRLGSTRLNGQNLRKTRGKARISNGRAVVGNFAFACKTPRVDPTLNVYYM